MLKKIQTVWFLLAIAALISMLFFPIFITQQTDSINDNILHIYGVESQNCFIPTFSYTYPLLISNLAVAFICFTNIFIFENKNQQKRMAIITIFLIIMLATLCFFYIMQTPGRNDRYSFGLGIYMPALAILFIVLAIFGINKDERLIRSAERLR